MIGAGNVAWHLSQALSVAGFLPLCVFSRNINKAQELAGFLECQAVDSLENVATNADMYIVSVKDDAIFEVAEKITSKNPAALYVHTAGSVSVDIFKGLAVNYGVLYPLQTFTKERPLDFCRVPLFVEGNNPETESAIANVAEKISSRPVIRLCSESRRRMHLAAVFASNFVNHCYACAEDIVKSAGVSFDVLFPLIEETCNKLHTLSPREAQTGPAVRNDRKVMRRQEELLNGTELNMYRLISRSIYEKSLEKEYKNSLGNKENSNQNK